jgi:hypothetical protein
VAVGNGLYEDIAKHGVETPVRLHQGVYNKRLPDWNTDAPVHGNGHHRTAVMLDLDPDAPVIPVTYHGEFNEANDKDPYLNGNGTEPYDLGLSHEPREGGDYHLAQDYDPAQPGGPVTQRRIRVKAERNKVVGPTRT